jgi:putative membrane protein
MSNQALRFGLFWALNVLVLWVSDALFDSVRFDSVATLVVSGLLFGIAHAVIKPVLVVLTLPVTVLTLGLFLLVINALILLLVAWAVPGFYVAGFWPAVWVGLFISVLSFVLNVMLGQRVAARQ